MLFFQRTGAPGLGLTSTYLLAYTAAKGIYSTAANGSLFLIAAHKSAGKTASLMSFLHAFVRSSLVM
jgi:hypothetical protein